MKVYKEYIEKSFDNTEDLFEYLNSDEEPQELIRCKDCLWHYGTICRRNNTMFWNDDDFCSHAEREEYETD